MLNTISAVIGSDYVYWCNEELLIEPQGERHAAELAMLFKVRLAIVSEVDEHATMNEARIKKLSGGDPITCRRMREDWWSFLPTHKIVMLTNHKPKIRGRDHAIWRRLGLVPFDMVFGDPSAPPPAVHNPAPAPPQSGRRKPARPTAADRAEDRKPSTVCTSAICSHESAAVPDGACSAFGSQSVSARV